MCKCEKHFNVNADIKIIEILYFCEKVLSKKIDIHEICIFDKHEEISFTLNIHGKTGKKPVGNNDNFQINMIDKYILEIGVNAKELKVSEILQINPLLHMALNALKMPKEIPFCIEIKAKQKEDIIVPNVKSLYECVEYFSYESFKNIIKKLQKGENDIKATITVERTKHYIFDWAYDKLYDMTPKGYHSWLDDDLDWDKMGEVVKVDCDCNK